MAKESTTKTQKSMTKKHLAKVERERRQNRILTIGIITIIAAVVILVALSMYSDQINDFYITKFVNPKAAAKVGDSTITVKEFHDRVSYERFQLVYTYETYASSYFASFFQDQLQTWQDELDNYIQFGSDTLDTMIGERALMLKANQMGITVTDEELEEQFQTLLNYYPKGTPTTSEPTATMTYYPTSTLNSQQETLTYKTPTSTPTETAIATEIEALTTETPTEAPTEDATAEVTEEANATPTETPTITPTATPYTYEGYQSYYSTVVANLTSQTSFTEAELREYIRSYLYQQKVFLKVSESVSPDQEMVWARHILVADEATAQQVLDKLKAGEDWNTLALEYSTDTSTSADGGDLGWFTKGKMVKPFEDAAWALGIGEISEPVETDYGFHIIQVLGHEVRQLSADELSTAQTNAYNQFIEDAKEEFGVTKYDVWAKNVPTEPTIPDEYRLSSQ